MPLNPLGFGSSPWVEGLFWVSAAWGAYVYVGYPLLVALLGRLRRSAGGAEPPTDVSLPSVTLLIAAYNEEAALADKLENSLALDYPALQIVVLSDGSTDRTDEIALSFASRGVELIRVEGRQGKTAAQNEGVARTEGEVIVFSDANSLYDPDAIRRLVEPLADRAVGVVEGRRVDHAPGDSETAATVGERSFRDYESWIKASESRFHTCVGATGPIYAVRRSAYVPLDPSEISDLLEPLMVNARHGLRQVFAPGAVSREPLLARGAQEFPRKVRIITRCLASIARHPSLWLPIRRPLTTWQLWSHRLLRWLLPIPLLVALGASVALVDLPFYRAALVAQVAFYLLALVGHWQERGGRAPAWSRYPYYFCLANLAALVAIGHALRGRRFRVWSPERSGETREEQPAS